jgi:chromosome partitioning protein
MLNVISNAQFSYKQLLSVFSLTDRELDKTLRGAGSSVKDFYNFEEVKGIGTTLLGSSNREVYCIANDKGGVGKTLYSYQLSQRLQLDGKRVLVVDLDGQRNLTKFFILGETELSLVNYFSEEKNSGLDEICIDIDESLSIIPSNKGVGRLNTVLDRALYFNQEKGGFDQEINTEALLRFIKDFNFFSQEFDAVIIDSAPNFGLSNFLAFTVATKIVVPTEPERHNLDGVNAVVDFAKLVEETLGCDPLEINFFFNESRPISKKTTQESKDVLRRSVQNYGYHYIETEMPYSEFFYLSSRDGVPFWLATVENPSDDDINELKDLLFCFNNLLRELDGREKIDSESKHLPKQVFKAMW